jgi:hypothetical protein
MAAIEIQCYTSIDLDNNFLTRTVPAKFDLNWLNGLRGED